ncbi:MAG: hypothetical protein CM1200mP10_13410 [Candidatus Neomarinimicrobiota bacterium]|nr:MAG: hypothetical protein CM1200mP10_13410 [Candidatus Neomarinimicrobiota bacterium]
MLKKVQPEEDVVLDREPVEEEKRFLNFARSRSKGIKLQGIKKPNGYIWEMLQPHSR